MKKLNESFEGGGITSIASPSPIRDKRVRNQNGGKIGKRSYLNKRIMPNVCAICAIGIGTSMQLIDKVWQQHRHICKEAKKYKIMGKSLKVCDVCHEDLTTRKNKK